MEARNKGSQLICDGEEKSAQTTTYMWMFRSGGDGEVYRYSLVQVEDNAKELLEGISD